MMGKLEYWRQIVDDIEAMTWHPYLDCDDLDDDDIELGFLSDLMYLIGKSPRVLERFLFHRVYRQYGIVQCMPQRVAHYRWRQIDVPDWGPSLPYGALVEGYHALQPSTWDVRREIVEAPITPEYGEYLALHPPPHITILDEPAPIPATAPAVAPAGGVQVGQ